MFDTSTFCEKSVNLRGINEATTQYFAIKMSGFDYNAVNKCSYTQNSICIGLIDEGLEKAGHDRLLMDSYFNKNDEVAMVVDTIGGDGTYNEIARLMDITDFQCFIKDPILVKQAKNDLYNICLDFYNKCK